MTYHFANIVSKLGVLNRHEAIAKGIAQGVIRMEVLSVARGRRPAGARGMKHEGLRPRATRHALAASHPRSSPDRMQGVASGPPSQEVFGRVGAISYRQCGDAGVARKARDRASCRRPSTCRPG